MSESQTPISIVGISGSLSSDSSTVRMLNVALEGATIFQVQTTLIDLRDYDLPFCDGRSDYTTYPDHVQKFRAAVRGAQGLILATPEYHNSLSGVLKNALDLLTPSDVAGKICGLIGVAGGGHGAINSLNTLRTICRGLGAWVAPQQVSVSHVDTAFTDDGALRDHALAKRVQHLGAVVAEFARLHHSLSTQQSS